MTAEELATRILDLTSHSFDIHGVMHREGDDHIIGTNAALISDIVDLIEEYTKQRVEESLYEHSQQQWCKDK